MPAAGLGTRSRAVTPSRVKPTFSSARCSATLSISVPASMRLAWCAGTGTGELGVGPSAVALAPSIGSSAIPMLQQNETRPLGPCATRRIRPVALPVHGEHATAVVQQAVLLPLTAVVPLVVPAVPLEVASGGGVVGQLVDDRQVALGDWSQFYGGLHRASLCSDFKTQLFGRKLCAGLNRPSRGRLVAQDLDHDQAWVSRPEIGAFLQRLEAHASRTAAGSAWPASGSDG